MAIELSRQFGISGFSGYSGYSGFSGYSGVAASGYSGYSGIGLSGFSGYSGAAGTGGGGSYSITQGAHGFVVGEVVRLSGTNYVLAEANNETNAEVAGMVSDVINTNEFELTTQGLVEGLTGLTPGQIYYLSPTSAGALQTNDPLYDAPGYISKPVFLATTTTDGYVFNFRGAVLDGGPGTSGYSGVSGYSGYSGTSGYSGYSGYSGTSGYSGYSGIGTSGYSGYSGSAAVSGYSGYSGTVYSSIWMMQTSDRTLTSTTSAQRIFGETANGQLDLLEGMYAFEGFVYLTGMSATSGNLAIHVQGGGDAITDRWGWAAFGVDASSPLNASARGGSASVTNTSVASITTAATGTGCVVYFHGKFRCSTAGTLIPSLALVTATAATLKAGSHFELRKIGSYSVSYVGDWS